MSTKVAKVYPDVEGGEGAGVVGRMEIPLSGIGLGGLKANSLDDEISFIEVYDGFAVTLYQHPKQNERGGESLTIQGPKKVNLHKKGMADTVSSISATRSTGAEKAARKVQNVVQDMSAGQKQALAAVGVLLVVAWILN
jgi:hypothetical protein